MAAIPKRLADWSFWWACPGDAGHGFQLNRPRKPCAELVFTKVLPQTTVRISRLGRATAVSLLATTGGKGGSSDWWSRQLGGWFGAQQPAMNRIALSGAALHHNPRLPMDNLETPFPGPIQPERWPCSGLKQGIHPWTGTNR